MRIIDRSVLFQDHQLIRRVVTGHPLYPRLNELVGTLEIVPIGDNSGSCACIKYDSESRLAVLSLAHSLPMNGHTEYVLLHEFTHVIDRENPTFNFSEREEKSLTDKEHWRFVDLWNLLIDARLNKLGQFVLQSHDTRTYCTIKGNLVVAPAGIEGKLLCHISSLESTGMVYAEAIVREVWANPKTMPTFNELIAVAKKCLPNQAL